MKINEFIELYKNEQITNLAEVLEVKNYVPFSEKYELCSSVLEACNEIDERTGLITVDSMCRYTTFIVTLLSMYTNLEFSLDENSEMDSIDEYDLLCKHRILKPILALLGDEYDECEKMLMTMHEDMITNHNTLHSVVGTVGTYALDLLENFVGLVKGKMESFDLSQVDLHKYKDILEKLGVKE